MTVDSRLLDSREQASIQENFDRILAMIDGIDARITELDKEGGTIAALDARITALEEDAGGTTE